MPPSNINHNSWFWVTARLVAVILVPRMGYSARRPPIGAQRINRTRKAFIKRLKPRRRKQEASRLAAPATTEIRIAMLDPRHVDATYTFAGWLLLEAAALRRGEDIRVTSDNEAKQSATQSASSGSLAATAGAGRRGATHLN
jgi:hypothetical protein